MYIWLLIVIVAFGLPYLAVWLNGMTKTRRFVRARMSELANPHDASARFQLGQLHLKYRRYRRAQPYLEEALALQEKGDCVDPRLLHALGDVLLGRRQWAQAIAMYERSLDLEPGGGQGDVFLRLGTAHRQLGNTDEAAAWLDKACDANRSLAEPIFRRACIHARQGHPDKANQLLDDFLPDANKLPAFIRRTNRRWILLMYLFPITRWMF